MEKVYIVAGNRAQYERFVSMATVNPKDFPFLERKSQLLGINDFPYILFGEFYSNEAYNDLMFKAKRGEEMSLSLAIPIPEFGVCSCGFLVCPP
jgi:hypothetical protein